MVKGRSVASTMAIGLVVVLLLWPHMGQAQSAGTTVQETLDRLSQLSGPARQRVLEEDAIKEGKIIWYSSNEPNLLRAWNEAFKARYPKIDAQFVRMTTSAALQRTVSESQAGHPIASLLDPTAASLAILQRNHALARYVSPESQDFDAEAKDPQGLWTAYWYATLVASFNTTLIAKAQVPISLEGLATPALKGRLGFPAVTGSEWVAAVLKVRGEPAGKDVLAKIAAQGLRLYDSHTALGNALASGQVAVAVEHNSGVAGRMQQAGAPLDWVVPEPLLVQPIYLVIPKDAPQPYAAALVYDWLLSKEAQAFYKERGFLGPRKDVAYGTSAEAIMKTAKSEGRTIVYLSANLVSDLTRFNKIFEELFVRR